jgi:hypothetical protein
MLRASREYLVVGSRLWLSIGRYFIQPLDRFAICLDEILA